MGDTAHFNGDILNIYGDDPVLAVTDASLIIDAGGNGRDKAVVNLIDTVSVPDGAKSYLGFSPGLPPSSEEISRSVVRIVNGEINAVQESPMEPFMNRLSTYWEQQ